MTPVTISFDTNAHIGNLRCEIEMFQGAPLARILFDNLYPMTITDIKFKAKGYNAFGEPIEVNGEPYFAILKQNINVKPLESVPRIYAELPNNEIRSLDIEESLIKYQDGTIVKYQGKNEIELTLLELDTYGSGKEITDAIKYFVSSQFQYMPLFTDKGWVCGCGRYNDNANNECYLCGTTKATCLALTSRENLTRLIQKYRRMKREKEEDELIEATKAKKKES